MLKGCSSGLQQLTFKHNIYTYKKNSSLKNYTSSMWALKAENFVKNRVNDAKFVNFNTVPIIFLLNPSQQTFWESK